MSQPQQSRGQGGGGGRGRGRRRGRHRSAGAGPGPSNTAGNEITGKRNTQAKNARYARPLPLELLHQDKSKQGWWSYISNTIAYLTTSKQEQEEQPLIAYWDATTFSAWVQVTSSSNTDVQTRTTQQLWDSGFFGKGSLSRSEPTWRMRKLNSEKVKKQRERGMKVYTPEELTALRRKERLQAKIERARLAVKAGTQLPDGIVALGGTLTEEEERVLARKAEKEVKEEEEEEEEEGEYGKHIPGLIYLGKGNNDGKDEPGKSGGAGEVVEIDEREISIEEMEWLHVSPVEIFFLTGMLGVLEVRDPHTDESIPLATLYTALLQSQCPSLPASISEPNTVFRPDNPFLLSYLVYHHYRSLGWVVKSGLKFCCDWLLYKRGPVFGHAEFAVVIIPVYSNPSDADTTPFGPHAAGGDRDWVWFSTMNRVQTQVLKTLVLTHITIPSVDTTSKEMIADPNSLVKGLKEGKLHTIKEVSLRRWVPARMRA
ncbi:unnamed protein product [Sympodiomycopsis kandeliae]